MKFFWNKCKTFARKIYLLFPFTALGFVLLSLLSYLAWSRAFRKQNFVLEIIFWAFSAFLVFELLQWLIALVITFFELRKLHQKTLPYVKGQTREWVRTGLEFHSIWYLPSITQRVASLNAQLQFKWVGRHEEVFSERRVKVEDFKRQVVLEDGFGIIRSTFEIELKQSIELHTRKIKISPQHFPQFLTQGDLIAHPMGAPQGDYMEMRSYQFGDPLKRILWKHYGRHRKLLVRLPEKAVAPQTKISLYLGTGPQDEYAAEWTKYLFEDSPLKGRIYFGAPGFNQAATQENVFQEALLTSAFHKASPEETFPFFVKSDPSAQCLLVLSPGSDFDEAHLKRLQQQLGMRLQIFVLGRKLKYSQTSSWQKRFLEKDSNDEFEQQILRLQELEKRMNLRFHWQEGEA